MTTMPTDPQDTLANKVTRRLGKRITQLIAEHGYKTHHEYMLAMTRAFGEELADIRKLTGTS